MAGQEQLWRVASLVGSSGKCQGGVNSVSMIKGHCQKWCLPVSDQLGKRVKKGGKWYRPALLSLKKVPTNTCFSNTCPKICEGVTFTYDPGDFQITASALGFRKSAILVSYRALWLSQM